MPGTPPSLKNGDLRSGYLARVARVIERADALGAAIILSLYYQRQDQYLQDERAVRAGVVNAVDWIRSKGYRNVILEVANEYGHRGFDHAILRSDAGVAGLIRLAKNRYPALPVSASYLRNGQTTSQVAAASDLILVHFNSLSLSDIAARVRALRNRLSRQAHRLQRGCADRIGRGSRGQRERQGRRLVRPHGGAPEPALPLRFSWPEG